MRDWAQKSSTNLRKRGIQWIFAPAKAPEWGGAYERMVGLFKKIFGGVVDGSQLSVETFHTFAISTEGILNSRPLVPVPVDRRDPEALSPLSFLCPGIIATSSADVLPPMPVDRLPLARSWHFIRGMLDQFWHRWTREYLSLLQNRRKWAKEQRNLKVGDVVLLVDKQTPRDQWPLGVIITAAKGEDQLVRRVSVRTAKSASLDRHVAHVVLLEATPDEEAAEGASERLAAAGGTSATMGDTPAPHFSSSSPPKESEDSTSSSMKTPTSTPTSVIVPLTSSSDSSVEPSESSTLPAVTGAADDRRSRIGVPLRSVRLAHPHGL